MGQFCSRRALDATKQQRSSLSTPAFACQNCLMPCEKPFRCSSCRAAIYCSTQCQRSDWPVHKHACKKLGEKPMETPIVTPGAPNEVHCSDDYFLDDDIEEDICSGMDLQTEIAFLKKQVKLIFVKCMYCQKTGVNSGHKLMTCSICRFAKYCSPQCQTAHWKNGHKIDCYGPGTRMAKKIVAQQIDYQTEIQNSADKEDKFFGDILRKWIFSSSGVFEAIAHVLLRPYSLTVSIASTHFIRFDASFHATRRTVRVESHSVPRLGCESIAADLSEDARALLRRSVMGQYSPPGSKPNDICTPIVVVFHYKGERMERIVPIVFPPQDETTVKRSCDICSTFQLEELLDLLNVALPVDDVNGVYQLAYEMQERCSHCNQVLHCQHNCSHCHHPERLTFLQFVPTEANRINDPRMLSFHPTEKMKNKTWGCARCPVFRSPVV